MTWQTTSFAILAAVLLVAALWFERRRPPAKVVALVAALAALAVVGRLAFAAIPNVKPTTDIVLFAGYALGAVPGFAVGAVTALASNVFLGQGPWTAWQMVAWGGVGVSGALLAWVIGKREIGRVQLALACGVAGLAFGAFMDVYQWSLGARQDLASYGAVSVSSLPYNLAHAIGNVVFCLLIGPAFLRALRRYRRRFEVRWELPGAAAAGGAAAAAVILALTLALSSSAPANAAVSASERAARYLVSVQNRDGGFGGDKGQSSNGLYTGWAALGLESAGFNPRDVARRGGKPITRYLSRTAGGLRDTGALERTIMVVGAAGVSPRSLAGRDLVAALLARRRADGSFGGNVAHTAFGIFALRAAGVSGSSGTVQRSAGWLERAQNRDGGWGFVPTAESDVDDTGAVMQALAVAGRTGTVGRAAGYLRSHQNRDGGFGQMDGRSSNAQSTAWAVQGLVAARARLSAGGRDPIRYLKGLQRADGHIAYARTSDQTPVWVTAQALMALRRKAFPLARVPRERRAAAQASAVAVGGSAVGVPSAPRQNGARGKAKGGKGDEAAPDGEGGASYAAGGDGAAEAPPEVAEVPGLESPSGAEPGPAAATGAPEADDRGGPALGWMGLAAVVVAGLVLLVRRRLISR